MTFNLVLIAIVALLVLLVGWGIATYNTLARSRVTVQDGFSGVGTYLQQRNDLLPNLVETVKGYAGHESKTLIEVIKWRNQSAGATTVAEQNEASQNLNKALINLLQVAEAYPSLKADAQFSQLMRDLKSLEGDINNSRRYYNGAVRQYNQEIVVFPKNILAGMFGFNEALFFKEDDTAHKVPTVSFS